MNTDAEEPGRRGQWLLTPATAGESSLPVALADMVALLEQLGRSSGSDEVAEQLLRLLGRHVPLAQCTIFSFQGRARPRIVGLGDRARTGALPMISQDYSERFYPLDGARRIMQAELARQQRQPHAAARVWLHRQRPSDVSHPEYRHVCYVLPRLVERLSLLALQPGGRWLAVNLYRGEEHGCFDALSIARIETFAPLVMQAMRLHYAGQALQDDLAGLVLARLARRFPGLTQRDLDVVRCVVEGLDAGRTAQRLGITLASARTYLKRVCAKLGVQGRRELFALLMEPQSLD
ncbi:ATP-dependent transcriptional regulator [Delftia tsuruhatensis]|uniref:helix-turn-helix transcriptional regulator n=1 Tax=Delftia tsuruhatensis TaxID=180282 RepID=UPI001E80EF73|nr:helix-turn-helix transcriptional regulator [Delftia tsuruhatensis]CAB5672636.1 ATP-dependent transcriptional regulator [Delftia tsuruhatensis]CAC9683476.1 ATP-dependent transcriptional regulator [Delftia tsuruhatensis]